MADRPRQDSTPNPSTKITRKFRDIDPDDPNDKALRLVTNYGVPYEEAIMKLSGVKTDRSDNPSVLTPSPTSTTTTTPATTPSTHSSNPSDTGDLATVSILHLGKSLTFMRGFHASSQGSDDLYQGHDINAIQGTTLRKEFIGRIAREMSESYAAILQMIEPIGIYYEASFVCLESEWIHRRGGRGCYESTKVIVKVNYFANEHESLHARKVNELSGVARECGLHFIANENTMGKHKSPSNTSSGAESSSKTYLEPMEAQQNKRLKSERCLVLLKNENLDLVNKCNHLEGLVEKNAQALVKSEEQLDSIQSLQMKAYLLQCRIDQKIGCKFELACGNESQVMSGIKWRLVGVRIVYDVKGNITTSRGEIIHELVYQQTKQHSIFKNWTRFERKAGEISLGCYWRSGSNNAYQSISDLESWVNRNRQNETV